MSEEAERGEGEGGLAHPRARSWIVGHEAAEAACAEAVAGRRPHHAWLISGPKGVGKATLAYRFARVLLGARTSGPRPFDVPEEDVIFRQIAGEAHPDLFVLTRGLNERGKPRRDIVVEDARALTEFLTLQPARGGWRVAIIDALDDLNRNAANALLKTLEEPPKRTALLLIAHAPGAALATIRSRCRRLTLQPLPAEACAAAVERLLAAPADPLTLAMAAGAPGRAAALQSAGAGEIARQAAAALSALPERGAAAFYDFAFTGRDAALALDILARLVRAGAAAGAGADLGTAESAMLPPALVARIEAAPERWAQAWADLQRLAEQRDALNLDDAHALLRAGRMLDQALAAGQAAPA